MTLNTAKHKNILTKILKEIFTDADIAPYLGFKGGTAAFLFYGLDRFSVDLDFDLLEESEKDAVFDRVKAILGRFGRLKEAAKKRFGFLYLLAYDNKEVGEQNVKVEINIRNFGSKYEIKPYLGISMKVMVREDMAAHKLCAMAERIGKTNRDIYDVQFFLAHNWPVNKKIVEERSGGSYAGFLKEAIRALEKYPGRSILAGMGELMESEKKKAWVREKLVPDTIFLLRLALENEKK